MTNFASCSIIDGIATITLDDGKANGGALDEGQLQRQHDADPQHEKDRD